MLDLRKTLRRRLYVLVAVALAAFLLSMAGIGIVCHGFALSLDARSPLAAPQTVVAATTELQPPIPQAVQQSLAAANEKGLAAYRTTQSAVDQYQATAVEMQDLLTSHFDDLLKSVLPTDASSEKPSPAQSPITPLAGSAATPNPRWQELNDKLVQLKVRRAELSTSLLPTHPMVQWLDESIADLQQQLKSLPKELPSATADTATLAASATRPANPFATFLPHWQQTAKQFQELSARLEAQQSECYQALNQESTAWQRKAEIPAEYLATLKLSPTSPARFAQANPRRAILGSALFALIIGAFVARGARVPEAIFRTAAEVRQRLAVTILGILPHKSSASLPEQPIREPRWIKRALLAAELCLALVVLSLVVASALDHHFFSQLLTNPLAACSQKLWC